MVCWGGGRGLFEEKLYSFNHILKKKKRKEIRARSHSPGYAMPRPHIPQVAGKEGLVPCLEHLEGEEHRRVLIHTLYVFIRLHTEKVTVTR